MKRIAHRCSAGATAGPVTGLIYQNAERFEDGERAEHDERDHGSVAHDPWIDVLGDRAAHAGAERDREPALGHHRGHCAEPHDETHADDVGPAPARALQTYFAAIVPAITMPTSPHSEKKIVANATAAP